MKKPVDARLLAYARTMRQHAVPAEHLLWQKLRNNQLAGLKFRRQHPVNNYIVDFCCEGHKLVIELDGDTHAGREAYDAARSAVLARSGYTIIRFPNAEIYSNLAGVLETILHRLCPHPNPLPEGEGTRRRP